MEWDQITEKWAAMTQRLRCVSDGATRPASAAPAGTGDTAGSQTLQAVGALLNLPRDP